VAGVPLPYFPVNVNVDVAAGVLAVVLRVAVLVFELDPLSDRELEESVHVEPDGAPLQESATVPVKPLTGVKVIV
jgi:hypothetical protein